MARIWAGAVVLTFLLAAGSDADPVFPSLAYVIATYEGSRHVASYDPVPPEQYLRLHLRHLATLPQTTNSVLIVRPPLTPGQTKLPRYYEVHDEVLALEAEGISVRWIFPTENEGSYAQLFSAYEATKGEFDYYFWLEDDCTFFYLPTALRFCTLFFSNHAYLCRCCDVALLRLRGARAIRRTL